MAMWAWSRGATKGALAVSSSSWKLFCKKDFWSPLSTVASGRTDIQETRVFILAGEPSGDVIGSRLMESLRRLSPKPLRFAGVGGALMEDQGLHTEFKMEEIAVMGVAELFPHLLRLWVRLRQTVAAAIHFEPHVVITIDAKGFSFRALRSIAASYRKMGFPRPLLVHYVAPSYWAWKGGEEKLRHLAGTVDHLLCILPFEEALCKAHGVGSTFVGHPVLDDAFRNVAIEEIPAHMWWIKGDGPGFRKHHGLHPGATVLTVLPGSRLQEVKRMLPLFEGALGYLADKVQNVTAVIPTAPSPLVTDTVARLVKGWKTPVILLPGASERLKYDAFAASNAGLCTSGTAVVQLQMARVPSVVAYRAHPLTEWLIQSRTKLRFISLPNILLDQAVIPESLFAACTPEHLAGLLRKVLTSDEVQKRQAQAAEQVLAMLAPPTSMCLHSDGSSYMLESHSQMPSMAAASTVLGLLDQHRLTTSPPLSY